MRYDSGTSVVCNGGALGDHDSGHVHAEEPTARVPADGSALAGGGEPLTASKPPVALTAKRAVSRGSAGPGSGNRYMKILLGVRRAPSAALACFFVTGFPHALLPVASARQHRVLHLAPAISSTLRGANFSDRSDMPKRTELVPWKGRPVRQLADVLLADGVVTEEQLAEAGSVARAGTSLGQSLVSLGHLSETQLGLALAASTGLQFLDLTEHAVDSSAVSSVPAGFCARHTLLPVGYEQGRLVVAMADPSNVFAIDDLRLMTGTEIRVVLATKPDLLGAITRYHRADADLDDLSSSMDSSAESAAPMDIAEVVEDAPIVRFVNLLIHQAIADSASDIHLEPGERELRVRFRIDGVLHEVMRSPRSIQAGVTSRLKIMADIDIAERRLPQDGRISLNASGKKMDLRVATLPTVWGEKVVMRLLDNSTAVLPLEKLGFRKGNYQRYAESFSKPYGMILVTGPTGSGKSTTLYATLNIVSTPEKNVITVEDPVEYRLPGINQVQVNTRAGLTFARALRSILRSDPDVVLIGEIRDHETAQIAIEASLTGHLVLSTLHTNDAPSAVTRLVEMGIEPFLVGSALDAVLAQRLARRLCPKCKEPYVPTAETLGSILHWSPEAPPPTIYRATGCSACASTGYRGRLALHEVMTVDEEIERLAVARASAATIATVARENGMQTLREDGLAKVVAGDTSLEELFRVVT